MAGKDKKIAEYHKRHGPKRLGKKVGKKGDNLPADVRAIQCLLNLPLSMQAVGKMGGTKLPLSGTLDDTTQAAIDLYQSTVLGITDGIIYPGDATVVSLWANLPQVPTTKYENPAWLRIAQGEEDKKIAEFGDKDSTTNHKQILEYLKTAPTLQKQTVSMPMIRGGKQQYDDLGQALMETKKKAEIEDTPWCACFVNWCMIEATGDKKVGAGASAQKWSKWGVGSSALEGAVCAFHREPFPDSPGTGWHVGFFLAGSPGDGYMALLGGNQENKVCRKWYVGIEPFQIHLRWPLGA